MKKYFILSWLLLIYPIIWGQTNTDSPEMLRQELSYSKEDTRKVLILYKLSQKTEGDWTNAIKYLRQSFILADKIQDNKGKILSGIELGRLLTLGQKKDEGIALLLSISQLCEQINDKYNLALTYHHLGYAYGGRKGLEYYLKCYQLAQELKISEEENPVNGLVAMGYLNNNILDSALLYVQKSYGLLLNTNKHPYKAEVLKVFAQIYAKMGNYKLALDYFRQSLAYRKKYNVFEWGEIDSEMAHIFKTKGQIDSAIYHAKLGLATAQQSNQPPYILSNATILYDIYKNNDFEKALQSLLILTAAKDSVYNLDRMREIERITYKEQNRLQLLQIEKDKEEQKRARLILWCALGMITIVAISLLYNNRQKQKNNNLLNQQKEEIDRQRDKAEKTLSELKSTQNQLIQKEKLASLGELTAGIAHEIQNPLNFVNNFSELSVELANELKDEIKKPEKDWNLIEDLTNDLSSNQEKINHHGKRASSIVKGMLEHSRTSTGERALTDINALADEYLRLSYHGMRAKDKNFNADYKTDFQIPLSKISVVPQDIGRVLLNLYNNAFYAVHEKTKMPPLGVGGLYTPSTLLSWSPTVLVSTKQLDNQIIISVKDNGMGMSENVKAKIFQPFFTTKPTGEGTGLGLSLAYDIVTKGHGGSLEVISTDGTSRDNREGVGSEFIITLPLKTNGL